MADPFLDTSRLTDEQILERLGRAYSYLQVQSSLGHAPTVLSIKSVIEQLELERESRLQRNSTEEFNKKYPKDLDPINLGKLEE